MMLSALCSNWKNQTKVIENGFHRLVIGTLPGTRFGGPLIPMNYRRYRKVMNILFFFKDTLG